MYILNINNESYSSTDDQKTFTKEKTSLKKTALGAGCKNVIECMGPDTAKILQKAIDDKRKSYVIISKVKPGNVSVSPIPLKPEIIIKRFKNLVNTK